MVRGKFDESWRRRVVHEDEVQGRLGRINHFRNSRETGGEGERAGERREREKIEGEDERG